MYRSFFGYRNVSTTESTTTGARTQRDAAFELPVGLHVVQRRFSKVALSRSVDLSVSQKDDRIPVRIPLRLN